MSSDSRVAVSLLLVLGVGVACGGSATHRKTAPLAKLRVIAILTSERPVDGKEKVFLGPLAGYSVTAVNQYGERGTAVIDHAGTAVLSLRAGRYVLTTTDDDACARAIVTLDTAEQRTIGIECVAP